MTTDEAVKIALEMMQGPQPDIVMVRREVFSLVVEEVKRLRLDIAVYKAHIDEQHVAQRYRDAQAHKESSNAKAQPEAQ